MHAEMLTGLFAAIDRKDTDAFVDFLTEDASFRFGSAPAVVGREAIRDAVDGFFETVSGLDHTFSAPIVEADTLVFEGVVTYTRHDGSDISLPFANVFYMDGDRIHDYRIYTDIGPLYASQ